MAASYGEEDWSHQYDDGDYSHNSSTVHNDCVTYESSRYMKVAILTASLGLISTLASIAAIFVILVLKKYHTFMQRLVLYLCIAAVLHSAAAILQFCRIAYKSHNQKVLNLCKAAGFISQTTDWSLNIAYVSMTFNMTLAVVFNTSSGSFEILYIAAIFLLPFTVNWIPFLQNSYGVAGAWCWIRDRDVSYVYNTTSDTHMIENCTDHNLGIYLQYILWYVPHSTMLFVILILYVLTVVKLICNKQHWEGLYQMESINNKELEKELVLPISVYTVVYFILNLFPLINRLHDSIHGPNYTLWVIHAVLSPIQGGLFSLLYTLDKDTRQKLTKREFLSYVLHRRTPIQDYVIKEEDTDSFDPLLPKDPKEDIKVGFDKETLYGSIMVSA